MGASADSFAADRKRVNSYALPASGSVPRLSVYLAPTGTTGQQPLRGVIYSDASGRPEGLLGVSAELTFTSTSAAGWYELAFPAPVRLAAGTYWIGIISGAPSNVAGFRYDTVVAARDINTNAYSSGPTDPFGLAYMDSKQMSLYASYEKGPPPDPVLAPALTWALGANLLERTSADRLALTLAGRLLSNEVFIRLP